MKHAADIAHFRQLCCLGIASQTVMPSLLKSLHGLVGSTSNSFYWAAENGDITNVYMEQLLPKDIAAYFFKEFVNNRTREFSALDLRKYLPNGQVVGNAAKVFPKSFLRSDVYNLIWRPQSRKQLLWARVRDAQGHANGIALSRVVGDAEFSERDEQLLTQLVPYLAHALNARPATPTQMVDGGESAVRGSVALTESFIADMDSQMREQGFGDPSIGKQVRSMVGSLKRVGEGAWTAADLAAALAAIDRGACGPVAPPDGLYLVKVDYPVA